MARAINRIKSGKPAAKGRKQARSAETAAKPEIKTSQSRTGAKPAIASKRAAAAPAPAGQVSKGELRAQIEKLEDTNTKLRAKNREAGRESKLSATRIAELEQQVARLEKRLKPKAVPAKSREKSSKTRSPKQQRLKVNPGEQVPPGFAVEGTTPLDQEAKKAQENLEEHLTGGQTREHE